MESDSSVRIGKPGDATKDDDFQVMRPSKCRPCLKCTQRYWSDELWNIHNQWEELWKSEGQTKRKAKVKHEAVANANAEVKTISMPETISARDADEWSRKEEEKEEKKCRSKIVKRTKCKAKINEEESSDENLGAKPRVAVKLFDGRVSWPLEISKWHLSDRGQLLLSCLLPTLPTSTEAESRYKTSGTMKSKKTHKPDVCSAKVNGRKQDAQDIVTIFERSSISRSVFQTQPKYTTSETHIWSPMLTPTFMLTPALTPTFTPPMTPTTLEDHTTPATPAMVPMMTRTLMPSLTAVIPTIGIQTLPVLTSAAAATSTQTSPTTSTLKKTVSSSTLYVNTSETMMANEMTSPITPPPTTQISSQRESKFTPTNTASTTANSLGFVSTSLARSIMTSATSAISKINPMMTVTMTPIIKRVPGMTSMASTITPVTNTTSPGATSVTQITSQDESDVKPNSITETTTPSIPRRNLLMHEPIMTTQHSQIVQCLSSPTPKVLNSSPTLPMAPVLPPKSIPETAIWALSPAMPLTSSRLVIGTLSTDPSTPTASSMSQTTPVPVTKLTSNASCSTSISTSGPSYSSDQGTIVTHEAANATVAHRNKNNSASANTPGSLTPPATAQPDLPRKYVPSENQHLKFAEVPYTHSNMSTLQIAQQILKRLTVNIQAQHSRLCDNQREHQPSTQDTQLDSLVSVLQPPKEGPVTNTYLNAVPLTTDKKQENTDSLSGRHNIQLPVEISPQENRQSTSTVRWRFLHPQSGVWFTLSLPEKNMEQLLQSPGIASQNIQEFSHSALDAPIVPEKSEELEYKLPDNNTTQDGTEVSTKVQVQQPQETGIHLKKEPTNNVQWHLSQLQNASCSSPATDASKTQQPLSYADQMKSCYIENVQNSQQFADSETQLDSTTFIVESQNDRTESQIKIEQTQSSSGDNIELSRPLTGSVAWRLWEPRSGSWISLNISTTNSQQVHPPEPHVQYPRLETEAEGKPIEERRENNMQNSNSIPVEQNHKSLETPMLVPKHLLESEKKAEQLCNESKIQQHDSSKVNETHGVRESLTLDLQSEQTSSSGRIPFWVFPDNIMSRIESASSDTWGAWQSSSHDSGSIKKTPRDSKCFTSKRRSQNSLNASKPPKKKARKLQDSKSTQKIASNARRIVQRYPKSGTTSSLRNQLATTRWLQRRLTPAPKVHSNHRFPSGRGWSVPRPVATEYNLRGRRVRQPAAARDEPLTICPADDANLNSVETPSLLLLCLTANTSSLPRALCKRPVKRTYCIIQNATTKQLGNPDPLPWKRASRLWRQNVANGK